MLCTLEVIVRHHNIQMKITASYIDMQRTQLFTMEMAPVAILNAQQCVAKISIECVLTFYVHTILCKIYQNSK